MSNKKGFYDDEVLALGGKLYTIPPKTKNPFGYIKGIVKIVKENKYNYVLRIGDNAITVVDLLLAKMGGAKTLALRSTNASAIKKISLLINKCFRFLAVCVPNVKFAPSTEAAVHTFGKRQIKKGKVIYLNNGIDVDKYTFTQQKRKTIHKELGLEGKFIVGHVGRFFHQKNHKFLISVFEKIAQKNENAHLVCVGTGELQDEIWNIVKSKGLEEKVSFIGRRADVPDVLCAFDVLLFPSFFEGMPNVVIESQASGLHCIISDSITKEANITGLVEYISLDKPADEWAEEVLKYSNGYDRPSYKDIYDKYGYDISSVVRNFTAAIFEKDDKN